MSSRAAPGINFDLPEEHYSARSDDAIRTRSGVVTWSQIVGRLVVAARPCKAPAWGLADLRVATTFFSGGRSQAKLCLPFLKVADMSRAFPASSRGDCGRMRLSAAGCVASRRRQRAPYSVSLSPASEPEITRFPCSTRVFIVTWNAGAEHIEGYKEIEIIGQHFSRFFTTEDQANKLAERMIDAARVAGRYEAEGWHVRKDGSRFWADTILQLVHDEQGAIIGFAKITRDITERVEAQNALLEIERRFRISGGRL